MSNDPIRQILYVSACDKQVDVDAILQQSRHNNAVDGITGLLWHGEGQFLQVLEGPAESVAATFARIAADPRHHSIEILSDRRIDAREFGYWSMERGDGPSRDAALCARMQRRLADARPTIRDAFAALLACD